MHSAALWLGLSGLVIIAVLMQRKIKARTSWLAEQHALVTHVNAADLRVRSSQLS